MHTFDVTEGGDDGTSPDDGRGPSIDPPDLPPPTDEDFEEWLASQDPNLAGYADLFRKSMEGQFSSSFNPHDMRKRQDAPNVYHPPHGPSVTSVARDFYNRAMQGAPNPSEVFMLIEGMRVDEEFV